VTRIVTWSSGDYTYVTYDDAAWREWAGAPEGSANMSEYRAYAEGDVWGWVVEKRVTWHADDPDCGDRETWEHVDSCWGYYGRNGANGEYLEQCARDALADAAQDSKTRQPALSPERIAAAIEDMQRVQRNLEEDRNRESSG